MLEYRFAMKVKLGFYYFDRFSMKTLGNGYEVNFLQKLSNCSICSISTKFEHLLKMPDFYKNRVFV